MVDRGAAVQESSHRLDVSGPCRDAKWQFFFQPFPEFVPALAFKANVKINVRLQSESFRGARDERDDESERRLQHGDEEVDHDKCVGAREVLLGCECLDVINPSEVTEGVLDGGEVCEVERKIWDGEFAYYEYLEREFVHRGDGVHVVARRVSSVDISSGPDTEYDYRRTEQDDI